MDMDPQSPPKRMTRARAAAKVSEPATKPARIVTAAAKTKPTRNTSTATATANTTRRAVKRKSPSDEDEEDHEMAPAKKVAATAAKPARGRGRPRKTPAEEAAPEPAPEPAPTASSRPRGRPKKAVETPAEEPAKPARTARTKRTISEDTDAAPEPVKKTTTRGRTAASTGTPTTAVRSLEKPAVKKTVKFEEPEKENIEPAAVGATKASTKPSTPAPSCGLRGKPVRKAASRTTASRSATSTRATASADASGEKPMPLSPKKVNQLTLSRVESDDELGMDERVPVKRLKKAPVKPASSSTKTAKQVKARVPVPDQDEKPVEVNRAQVDVDLMLATPAKRLPPSPWKGSIRSPARRVEGLFAASAAEADAQKTQATAKASLLQSPAKRQPINPIPLAADAVSGPATSPVKLSFLSSPAKRPISPIKALPRTVEQEEPIDQTPAPKPTLLASPVPRDVSDDPEGFQGLAENESENEQVEGSGPESPTRLSFPGRLSAVLPRHADPALTPPELGQSDEMHGLLEGAREIPAEAVLEVCNDRAGLEETMVPNADPVEADIPKSATTTPPSSPPRPASPTFGLREKDLNYAADSESEDDSPVKQSRFTSAFSDLPATPRLASDMTPSRAQSGARSATRRCQSNAGLGFTPLAQQLSQWTAGPSPPASAPDVRVTDGQEHRALHGQEQDSSSKEPEANTFFEDQMHILSETMDAEEEARTYLADDDVPVLEDVSFTEEDIALAAEANEMSLMERDSVAPGRKGDHDDSISEIGREYADENALPIDPTLSRGNDAHHAAAPPVTPQRAIRREFHTVAKVPLKPADDSTPLPMSERRSYSASRVSAMRPTAPSLSHTTAPSFPPSKGGNTQHSLEEQGKGRPEERADSVPPVTPQKEDIWSTMGTPARTPRRDLNPALLRGAVVFVDVHTSEGADASGIFVELLTQMGAQCVGSWAWDPSSPSDSGADPRVDITHVVFKDGAEGTLEKVRQSAGVVQCVGVSWVLDCERENQWLDEAPYHVDTSHAPRGGGRRRRQSMDPRAVGDLNSGGMLAAPPGRSSFRGCRIAPSTPTNNRRESALWVRTPEDSHADEAERGGDDDGGFDNQHRGAGNGHINDDWDAPLTPVPKTPAPEAIARYAAELTPGSVTTTPSTVTRGGAFDYHKEGSQHLNSNNNYNDNNNNNNNNGGGDREFAAREMMLTRTCPPKQRATRPGDFGGDEPGNEVEVEMENKEKDERLLMRLMAARRKSLQFAPKVGSPLAKTWKAWN